MSLFWVRRKARRAKSPVRRSFGSQPQLEALEGRLLLTMQTWSGAGTNTLFSNGANWVGGASPHAGDDLVFPASPVHTAGINDLTPGITLNSLTFGGTAYNITGNPLALSGGITSSNSTSGNIINVDVTLAGPQTFTVVNTGAALTLMQPLHLGGNTLTVTGLGSLTVANVIGGTGGIVSSIGKLTLSANNTYTGPTTVNGGTLFINGSQSSNAVTVHAGGAVAGGGTVAAITDTGGTIAPGPATGTGVLTADGNVTLDGSSSFNVTLNGTLAGQGYDQLLVNGAVNLGGSKLNAALTFASAVGNTYTIVHSTGGLSGTLQGLPDGAMFSFNGKNFRINYTANDAVLTHIPADTTTVVQTSVNSAVFGQSIKFTATVSALAPSTGTPTGTVSFTVDGGAPSAVTLSSGKATLTTLSLSVGNHTITATYNGDINFNPNGPVSFPQTVSKANSSTTLIAAPNPSGLGNTVVFTATIGAVSPGIGTPTGTVTFAVDGIAQPPTNLTGTQVTFSTSTLTAGNHSITATYSGDGNFNMSVSGAVTQVVKAIATTTTLTSVPNPSVFGQPITLTATVTPSQSSSSVPTGTVTFNNLNSSLGTAPLVNGVATISVSTLTSGTFNLTARYTGDSIFAPDTSSTLIQTVNPTPTTTQIMASIGSVLQGARVTFTAQVASTGAGAGVPMGTVVFKDGTTTLGQASLSNGTAIFTTSSFLFGKNAITAVYAGFRDSAASTSSPVIVEVGTPDQRFIAQMYVDLLGRLVDASGFNTWIIQISQGRTHTQIAQTILASQEYRTDVIESLYRLYLHRDADPGGLAFFLNRMAAGDTQEQVGQLIVGSGEYFTIRGGGSNDGFLDALYHDVLQRTVDPTGRAFFDAQLAAGMTAGQIAGEIFASGEYHQDLIQGIYQHFLQRPPDPVGLSAFLGALAGGARDEDVIAAVVGSGEYTSKA